MKGKDTMLNNVTSNNNNNSNNDDNNDDEMAMVIMMTTINDENDHDKNIQTCLYVYVCIKLMIKNLQYVDFRREKYLMK